MKKVIAVVLMITILTCLCACGGEQGSHVINFQAKQVPENIDPLLASTQSEKMVMENIYEGLFWLNDQGQIQGGCALGYTPTGNGTCIVSLRENLLWANGQPITPNDFIFGLQRAVSPETKASCAGQLTCIKGATEILQGKQPATTLGVKAVEENQLEFTLVGKVEALLAALSGPAGIPCNQEFFENCKGRYGTSREHVLSNGAFGLKGWSKEEPDVFVRLIRNENYWNAESVRPGGAYFTFGGEEEGYGLLVENKLDGTLLSGELVEDATQKGYTLLSQEDQTYGLLLNTKGTEIMKNVSLRKALMGAVNPEQLATYLPVSCKAATGLVMPGSFYATKPYPAINQFAQPFTEIGEHFNAAVKELGADALSNLQLWYVSTPENRWVIDYMVQCWQKEFGLYVTLKEVSQSELWYGLENGYCHMGIGKLSSQGGSSLETLETFSFQGTNPQNGFTDKTYDKLLKTAADSGEIAHQQQCEAYLMNEGYLLPLYITQTFYAFRSQILDVTLDCYTGVLQLEKVGKIG